MSSEHVYQALKFQQPHQDMIKNAATCGQTKRLAEKFTAQGLCYRDWHIIKVNIMDQILEAKFSNVDLAVKLLQTGDEELIEGNTWNDRFWGCVYEGDQWVGENHLGRLLMERRTILKKMIEGDSAP